MALDITYRKQSEEALSLSYQRLEALQEIDRAAELVIVVANLAGRI